MTELLLLLSLFSFFAHLLGNRSDLIRATLRFSSVINSVASPGPTITVRSPNRTFMVVKASQSANTVALLNAASFTSTVLPSAQVSVEPTAALTVKATTTSSVNGK